MIDSNTIKPIALYLPQFHEIPENNEWWGKGFTEWTNVKKAKPVFSGHYQPHVPLNDNYYDLTDIKNMRKQADLAKAYGIYGFCFYHYWFNGQLLLEKPIEQWLASNIDFNYCLSWANENWTRRWDGMDKEILMQQIYSEKDEYDHINYLIQFFKDPRYIKVGDKPVLLMYRTELHPNITEATEIWRSEAKKSGFEDLYLIRMENFVRHVDPVISGFDAGMEFAPDGTCQGIKVLKKNILRYRVKKVLHFTRLKKSGYFSNYIYDYQDLKKNMETRETPDYTYFRCACPSWDNSARRSKEAQIYINSSPAVFGDWVKNLCHFTRKELDPDKQFLFINAWNEWGEGCHIEPDKKYGYSFLEAVRDNL